MTRAAFEPRPRVELVVFDLDGTLADTLADLTTAVNRTLRHLDPDSPALPIETIRRFVGAGARALIERSLAAAGSRCAVATAMHAYLESYRTCLLDTTCLYPGVTAMLDALRERRLAVLTNKPGDLSRSILAGLGIVDRFGVILGGGDVPAHKPDPAGLRALCASFGVAPQHVALVGDSAIDVRTGRAANVRTVGVTWGFDPESFASDPPDAVADRPEDVPGLL